MISTKELYKRRDLADVNIVCPDGTVKAHSIILRAVSKPLSEALDPAKRERECDRLEFLVDAPRDSVKRVVKSIYIGSKARVYQSIFATDALHDMARLAREWKLPALTRDIENFIENHVNREGPSHAVAEACRAIGDVTLLLRMAENRRRSCVPGNPADLGTVFRLIELAKDEGADWEEWMIDGLVSNSIRSLDVHEAATLMEPLLVAARSPKLVAIRDEFEAFAVTAFPWLFHPMVKSVRIEDHWFTRVLAKTDPEFVASLKELQQTGITKKSAITRGEQRINVHHSHRMFAALCTSGESVATFRRLGEYVAVGRALEQLAEAGWPLAMRAEYRERNRAKRLGFIRCYGSNVIAYIGPGTVIVARIEEGDVTILLSSATSGQKFAARSDEGRRMFWTRTVLTGDAGDVLVLEEGRPGKLEINGEVISSAMYTTWHVRE